MPDPDQRASVSGDAEFMTTRWSVVAGASGKDELRAREALAILCHT